MANEPTTTNGGTSAADRAIKLVQTLGFPIAVAAYLLYLLPQIRNEVHNVDVRLSRIEQRLAMPAAPTAPAP